MKRAQVRLVVAMIGLVVMSYMAALAAGTCQYQFTECGSAGCTTSAGFPGAKGVAYYICPTFPTIRAVNVCCRY